MSRLTKFLLVFVLIVFILACNTVTKPFNDAQNVVETAQSFATAMPLETLQSFATNMPVETLQSISSAIPNFGDMFNPQGEPVSEWNGIPIMSQATAGQEFTDSKTYSFKANASVKEASDFYTDTLVKLGWSSTMSLPGDNNSAVLVYSKGSNFLTVTITAQGDATLVLLTMA
ncbi:MAG TPA: hypothetical protein VN653_18860 [Anaerolineales bacterium]|nr:hypothetical protein [Anaerolineales bacterium]